MSKISTLQDSNIDTAYDDTMLKANIISAKVVLYVNMKYDAFFAQTLDITFNVYVNYDVTQTYVCEL